jgi:hypothetical protein
MGPRNGAKAIAIDHRAYPGNVRLLFALALLLCAALAQQVHLLLSH